MRVREGGEIVERHAIVNSPTACVLGGEDGRDLFVTSTDMTGADPAGGRIDALRVSVPGPDWA
jgi:sugar lactone lactonase YvrE